MSQRKKPWGTYIFLGAILFSGFMVYMMFTGETNNGVVNLVLKKNNKTYVYSKTGTFLAKSSIGEQQSPSAFPFIQIFEEDDKLYIAPNNLKDITDLLCGNYQLHDYPEISSDGYVTSGGSSCFKTSLKNKGTENIGEQVQLNTVTLTDQQAKKTFNIKWSTNTSTYKSEALENCHKKSFMIKTSVQPGEFVISAKDFIVVDIADVVEFYGDNTALTWDRGNQLLYIDFNR